MNGGHRFGRRAVVEMAQRQKTLKIGVPRSVRLPQHKAAVPSNDMGVGLSDADVQGELFCDGLHGKAHHQDGTGPAAPHGVNGAGAQQKQPFSGRQGPVGHMELALRQRVHERGRIADLHGLAENRVAGPAGRIKTQEVKPRLTGHGGQVRPGLLGILSGTLLRRAPNDAVHTGLL